MRDDRLGLESLLSNQQGVVDEFVRDVRGRPGAAVIGLVLLADRYQRLSTLGLAVHRVWGKRDCAVCWFRLDGEVDGNDQIASRRWSYDVIVRLDPSESVFTVGDADQCIVVLRHLVHSVVAVLDVAVYRKNIIVKV